MLVDNVAKFTLENWLDSINPEIYLRWSNSDDFLLFNLRCVIFLQLIEQNKSRHLRTLTKQRRTSSSRTWSRRKNVSSRYAREHTLVVLSVGHPKLFQVINLFWIKMHWNDINKGYSHSLCENKSKKNTFLVLIRWIWNNGYNLLYLIGIRKC